MQEGNPLKFLKFWFPVFIYCCIIFGVSAIPCVQLPPAIPHLDKFIHATEYALLAGLFARAIANTNQKAWFPLVWAITVFFIVFYGITDEFHQSFVAGRSSDLADWMADTVGGMIGATIYLFWRNKFNKNSRRG